MKPLLDEDLPSKLRYWLRPEPEAVSVQDRGWGGQQPGELLCLLETAGMQAFLTGDQQLQHQQNWRSYSLPVLVRQAASDQYDDCNALTPAVELLLAQPALAGGAHAAGPLPKGSI